MTTAPLEALINHAVDFSPNGKHAPPAIAPPAPDYNALLAAVPSSGDVVVQQRAAAPLIEALAASDDHALTAAYLERLRAHCGWSRDMWRGIDREVKRRQQKRVREDRQQRKLDDDDIGTRVELMPDVQFINPAQAYRDGIVYLCRSVTRQVQVEHKHAVTAYDVHAPVIITSDRRVLTIPDLPASAPAGTIRYLDDARTLALRNIPMQATSNWSYDSLRQHLDNTAPAVTPGVIYDALMASLRQYVYHRDQSDYVIDVLWCMGTYAHQMFDAFPYLAINGHKGTGKTSLLNWLKQTAFNAEHVVNTSEASLFRWIEAAAPTMLIDEQEGLNSRQAGREGKADLMGLLKAGYQKGATVTRQDPDRPGVTQWFSVYGPKAIAAVEQIEDILADRSWLVFMHRPDDATSNALKPRAQMTAEEFQPLRDALYLMLMQWAEETDAVRKRVRSTYTNRFGELALPLIAFARLVDATRPGKPPVLPILEEALEAQSKRRTARNEMTPETRLKEALIFAAEEAITAPTDTPPAASKAQRISGDRLILDSEHIADAFGRLFPNARDSYFNLDWLGKQVQKSDFIHAWDERPRWRRTFEERDARTNELTRVDRRLSVYVVSLSALGA